MWERHPRTPGVELLFFPFALRLAAPSGIQRPKYLTVLYLHKGSSNTLLLPFKVPVHNPVISTRGRRSRLEHTRLVLRAITAGTHNPPLHLSHLQPFIRSRRQQSIHLPLSFTHTHTHSRSARISSSLVFVSITSTFPPSQSHLSLFPRHPSRESLPLSIFPRPPLRRYLTARSRSGFSNPTDVPRHGRTSTSPNYIFSSPAER